MISSVAKVGFTGRVLLIFTRGLSVASLASSSVSLGSPRDMLSLLVLIAGIPPGQTSSQLFHC